MQRYPPPRFAIEEQPSFGEALDAFFLGEVNEDGEEPDDPRRARYDEAHGKLAFQVTQIDEALTNFEREESERRADGEALYAHFALVQELLQRLQAARDEGAWKLAQEELQRARTAGEPWAQLVVELRPHEGSAMLRLPATPRPRELKLDVRRSVQENAEELFAASKKARSRRDGAQAARRDMEARLHAAEAKGLDAFGPPPKRDMTPTRHFWFEPYRWTLTPGGLLAVGGRNAAQNDAVVKKYLRDGDRYVHADAHGAPSVVLRSAPGEASADDLRAACQFAACASRAWRQGGSASAYWVTPAQISKTPRAGEYVPRGAWIVHGRRNVEDHLPLEWWVGTAMFTTQGEPMRPGQEPPPRAVRKLFGGPHGGVAAFVEAPVKLVPGDTSLSDAAAWLAERFEVSVEEAQAALPPGPVRWEDA